MCGGRFKLHQKKHTIMSVTDIKTPSITTLSIEVKVVSYTPWVLKKKTRRGALI